MHTRFGRSLAVSLAGAAALALASPTASAADQFVTIGGGGTGGTYFVVAAGMARLLEKANPNIKATARVSTGTLENTRLLGRKQIEFGLAGASGPWAAANSVEDFEPTKEKYTNIRYVCTGYSSTFQIMVPANSPVKTVSDFKGKRVGIVAGSTVTTWLPAVAEVYGVKGQYQGFALKPNELVDSLRDGQVDILVYAGAAPNPAMSDLASSKAMRMLGLSTDKAKDVNKLLPYWAPATMKKTMYPGMTEDIVALDAPNVLVTHADVPDEIVYAMTKVVLENNAELTAIHPLAGQFNVQNLGKAMVVPPHPGAARYYKEKGIALPQ